MHTSDVLTLIFAAVAAIASAWTVWTTIRYQRDLVAGRLAEALVTVKQAAHEADPARRAHGMLVRQEEFARALAQLLRIVAAGSYRLPKPDDFWTPLMRLVDSSDPPSPTQAVSDANDAYLALVAARWLDPKQGKWKRLLRRIWP